MRPLAAPTCDGSTLRTLFVNFDDADWETQLSDFYDTDIEVPASLRVDDTTLKPFVQQRRAFLLQHPLIKQLASN